MSPKNNKSVQTSTFSNAHVGIFLVLLAFRLVNALSIKTFFQPDEYFQSLEPAWKSVFGPQSGAWITWEWKEQLRSSIHPLIFSRAYVLANNISTALDLTPHLRAELLLAAPKVLQACFAAAGDYYTWQLALKVYGDGHVSWAALALTVCSPWQWFCSVRTLSNSLETALTVQALYYWPWNWTRNPLRDSQGQKKCNVSSSSPDGSIHVSLAAAALACVLRPTNTMIWATISLCLLARHWNFQHAVTILQSAILCGSAVLAVSLSVDKWYYGEWTFPPLKFLYFNIVKSLAVFYGTNRGDYYFTEGLPLLLTTALPFAAVGLWQAIRSGFGRPNVTEEHSKTFLLATAIITTVGALTCISHKEVRFIYPLLPMLHVLAAKPLANFFWPGSKTRLFLLLIALSVNVTIAGYGSLVHQRGVIDVLHFLRHEQEARLSNFSSSTEMTVGFLMPCHSTPWRSHLIHPQTDAWALTCEPPIDVPMEMRASYLDEADIFYENPTNWILNNMGNSSPAKGDRPKREWSQYLVFFEQLEPFMKGPAKSMGYEECWRGFNTHFHDDWRRHGDVIVWRRTY